MKGVELEIVLMRPDPEMRDSCLEDGIKGAPVWNENVGVRLGEGQGHARRAENLWPESVSRGEPPGTPVMSPLVV